MQDVGDRVALVTGASRGVGRGIALGLAHAGAAVLATGRSIAQADLDAGITGCDHRDDQAVHRVFDVIDEQAGRLDVPVNAAWQEADMQQPVAPVTGPSSGLDQARPGRRRASMTP